MALKNYGETDVRRFDPRGAGAWRGGPQRFRGVAGVAGDHGIGIVVAVSKFSAIILELAVHALKKPVDQSSPEAVAAALLLTHVAWNRTVDPLGGDLTGQYRKVLKALCQENPRCLGELKSGDLEATIAELAVLKKARHPDDRRVIRLCGLTEKHTVRADWVEDTGSQRN